MGVVKRGRVWYVRWKDGYGIWRRKRTGARTRKQALEYFHELSRQTDRQLLGLEARPLKLGLNLWKLCEWWLNNRCKKPSLKKCRSFLGVHVKRSGLGAIALTSIGPEQLESYFDEMEKSEYAPRTINLVRLNVMAVFTQAKLARMWAGENPARLTRVREVIRAPRPVLKPLEVTPLIHEVPPQWRNYFACACYLGLRKGELCGLRKADYDPVQRMLYVGRSYGASTTKGKRFDYLPVIEQLAFYLDDALTSPGPFLFPGPKGRMRTEEAEPEEILRTAFRRLGYIDGYLHKCRRCARKGIREPVAAIDDEPRWCKREGCGFKLWPVAIPRPMRAHDLRHTAATHLLQAGVKIQHVQRILRHASITTTVNTYGHLDTEDLRGALEKLNHGPRPAQMQVVRLAKLNEER